MKKLITVLLTLIVCSAFAQKTLTRCIGFSVYYHDYDPNNPLFTRLTDSAVYKYSGARPGEIIPFSNYVNLKFDQQIRQSTTEGNTITLQSFDKKDNVIQGLVIYQNTFDSISKVEFTYNANNDTASIVKYKYQNKKWVPYTREVKNYNTTHSLLSYSFENWNTTSNTWRYYTVDSFIYDLSGQLQEKRSYIWDNINNQWLASAKSINTYSNGNLTETLQEYFYNGAWIKYSKMIYGYTGILLDSAISYGWDSSTNNWSKFGGGNIYTYNGNHLLETRLEITNNANRDSVFRLTYIYDTANNIIKYTQEDHTLRNKWRNSSKFDIIYDQYGNQTELTILSGDSSGTGWQYDAVSVKVRYYFKVIDSTESVRTITSNRVDVNLFPLPASGGIMNIYAKWETPQSFRVIIYDMQGHTIQCWDEPSCSIYTHSINVGNLHPGSYILKLQGHNEQALKQFIVQ